ncbi:MAG: hypothetical protein WD276_03870 [Actinomycetota bacterium]
MQRIPVVLLFVFLLASCTQAGTTLDPLPQGPLSGPVLTLELSTARQAIVDFLHAYADAADDDAKSLKNVVAEGPLTHWAKWLAVQNENLPGQHTGAVAIEDISFVEFASSENGPLIARFRIKAQVVQTYVPVNGDPRQAGHDFNGFMELAQRGQGEWVVLDVTRDGASLAGAVGKFPDAEQIHSGVTVRLDSMFRFPSVWEFNFRVKNDSGSRAGVNALTTFLDEPGNASGAGPPVDAEWASPSLSAIPSGGTRTGIVNFPAQPDMGPKLNVLITFRIGGRTVSFFFPVDLRPAPASPSPSVGVSPAPSSAG